MTTTRARTTLEDALEWRIAKGTIDAEVAGLTIAAAFTIYYFAK